MRSAPTARRGLDRQAAEFRVHFTAKLADAGLAPTADTPVPTRPRPAPAPVPPAAAPAAAPPEPDFAGERQADRERVEAALDALKAAAVDLRKDQGGRLREWQRAAVELAMTIATRLLHDRVVSGEFPMEEKVRDMVEQFKQDGPVAVHLNPADLHLLEERLGGEPLLPGRDDPRVVPDPGLARGECRVEGREGMLLSDVTRELHEIRDELLRSLGNAGS